MRSNRTLLLVVVLSMAAACGGGGGGGGNAVIVPEKVVSISVTPANASISLGTGQQFTAVGVLSNSSKRSLTTAAWTSSNVSVATIDGSTGKAQSLATGTTLITAVSGSFSASTVLKVTSGGVLPPANNVLPVTVNGSLCSPQTSSNYPNKACVSVTVCSHGTSTCQTIDDILLDTGSYGLRVFSSPVLTVPLTQVAAPDGNPLAECVRYGDGSSDWGPVQLADVVLGGETVVNVPIQVIDQSFGTPSSGCNGPLADISPTQTPGAGFNGILGVGLFAQDCGSVCANSTGNGMYYSCSGSSSGSSCLASKATLTSQVQNPVSLLPVDNNGVILSFPSVDPAGVASASGSLVLGIGTQSNNQPWAVTMYGADNHADFITVFNGTTYTNAFIDSGSNGFYFPSAIKTCAGWYCPSSVQNLIATTRGASGTPSADVSFAIANVSTSANSVFNDLGAYTAGVFDWGMPFFFGRDVYFGIDGMSSPVGTGPYWAY